MNKKIMNGKEYVEVEFLLGARIKDAMKLLREASCKGLSTYGMFDDVALTSDMSLSEAYLALTGKTEEECEAESRAKIAQYEKEEAEYQARIPELTEYWKRKGRVVLSDDKIELWDKIVPIRLNDLYHGMELEACLELVRLLNLFGSFEAAKKTLNSQGHSGSSYSLVCSMVREFADRGKRFFEFISKQKIE